jgi:hypothetical protein
MLNFIKSVFFKFNILRNKNSDTNLESEDSDERLIDNLESRIPLHIANAATNQKPKETSYYLLSQMRK